jgi:membrane associated rhomboid family serine protease
MGIYDREYYRGDERTPGLHLAGNLTMTTRIVLVTVGIYLADEILFSGTVRRWFALRTDVVYEPWNLWQLFTSGLVHAKQPWHVIVNMAVFWIFGRNVERAVGPWEFLKLYVSLIILSSLVWLGAEWLAISLGWSAAPGSYGASGGVSGILFVYIFRNPKSTIDIWGVLPVPAWAAAILFIAIDVFGAFNPDSKVGVAAHLGGAAFGVLYFKTGWHLFRFLPRGFSLRNLRRPKMRLHNPDAQQRKQSDEADRILDKILAHGEESLTSRERKTLEDYSRRMQQKHR